MSGFIASLDATLAANSFKVFLYTLLGLGGVRIAAWVFDRPLRKRTGAGYASAGQLLLIGFFAAGVNFAFRLWAPQELVLGLMLAVVVPTASTFVLHRRSHRAAILAIGLVVQAVLAAAAFMVSWQFVVWAGGLWLANAMLGCPISRPRPTARDRLLLRRKRALLDGRYDEVS
ncbi:MAG: hypothetical protein KGH84_09145 [Paracoccaceae bacterium]|nr:hypothetical protein [Paracoccaceae bacterium]